MDPLTFSEDVEQRKRRLLPLALGGLQSPQGVLTNTVQPGQALPMSMRSRLGKVYEELSGMDTNEVDTSALQAFAKQQGEASQAAMLNALAAQYAGENFQPVQAQYLKRATAASEPMRIGQGMLTPDGQYIKDPFAARDTRRAALERQAAGLERQIEAQDRYDQTRQDRLAQSDRDYQLRKDMFDLRRDMAANKGEPGSFAPSGFTPEGQQVVINSKTGMSYLIGLDPNGQPTYTPHMGPMIPKATFEKNVEAARVFGAKADSSDALIEKIDRNPEAFGMTAAAVSKLPSMMQGRVGSVLLNEDTLKLRADVLRQAAMEISDIYGAAQSIGEAARAATFIPSPEDPPEVVIGKLRAARDYARANAAALGGAANKAAGQRTGVSNNPPSAAGGLTPAEQAELEQLRKKHRGG